ncbi:MAG: hypothetical protein J0I09_02835 [Sphingobacteriia bacterium]|nr:hypothetical protein [Sphingobacteriia bacterium]
MKKRVSFAGLLFALSVITTVSFSQVKITADSIAVASNQNYVLAGTAFNSDVVFLGRKSLTKSPYISTSAGYYHKSGLFISGIISYLAVSQQNRIDLFTATGGYDYYKKNLTTGVSVTGYIFNDKSYTTKSALTANLSAYADYDLDFLELYADGTMYFSGQSDFIFNLAASHNFYMAKDKLKVSPTFSLYGGTQNYYSNYNNNLRFGQHMLSDGSGNGMGTGMMGGASFNIQDYEFSIPVQYDYKHFRFLFYPVYAIPVNAATIVSNQNTYKEDLENTFFWSLALYYKIQKHKK